MKTPIETIAAVYEEELSIPEIPSANPFVLCPVGLVGAGKTTVVRPLAELFSLVRVSGDEIRKILKHQIPGYTQEDVHAVADILIKKYLRKGYGIAIDSNCGNKKEKIEKLSAAFGIPIVWIHIDPPEEFIIQKLRNYKHTWLFKDADEAIETHLRSKQAQGKLDMPFVYVFDTSRKDIAEQIHDAATVIRKQLGRVLI